MLKIVSSGFYLAGGTSLALQLGHRDSVDFDFFTDSEYDIGDLFEKVEQATIYTSITYNIFLLTDCMLWDRIVES
ncbi:nucleotidyl transferase AbiEii/AbiGii toxin family protein [Candidatus Shapirobacteria bacterium]|nr:nucleotidyl transferase AbiEii/AbiGii toxin family protein [Candidatus Shapirobacteria bacterium]